MKFEPRRGQAVGRIVVRPVSSSILRPDETKNLTKFVLIDAVGPDLEAKGVKVGDIVMPTAISGIVMENGASFRPMAEETNIALIIRDWESLDEFRVQNENGTQYVPFSDPRAAKSLGAIASERTLKMVPGNGAESRP
jgi:hypothetical protein